MATAATTTDPDVRLLVDGRIVRPTRAGGGVYEFAVAAGACEIRVISRSVVPAYLDPSLTDIRQLGICLVSMALRNERLEVLLRADDPAFSDGFHDVEPGQRWTNGRALLPPALLRAFTEDFTIELRLVEAGLNYPAA
jgi:hypothetical protein